MDVNSSQPITTEQKTGMSTWCLPMSFRPIADGTARSVVDLMHLDKPISSPPTPCNDEKLKPPDKHSCNIRAVRIEEDKPRHRNRTDKKDEMRPVTEALRISGENKPLMISNPDPIKAIADKNVHQTGKDHNWRWHEPREYCLEGAISEEKWPLLNPGKTRNAEVNNITTPLRQ